MAEQLFCKQQVTSSSLVKSSGLVFEDRLRDRAETLAGRFPIPDCEIS